MLNSLVAAAQKKPDRFRLRFFVDALDESPAPVEGLHVGRIDNLAVEQALDVKQPSVLEKVAGRAEMTKADYTGGRKVLFLVCGPGP
jgi:hypothetical protein